VLLLLLLLMLLLLMLLLLQLYVAVDSLATSPPLLMEFQWPDPLAPALDDDGRPPQWLTLRANTWGGRDWHCGLCNMWADPGHLAGQKHRNKVAQMPDPTPPVSDDNGQHPEWLTLQAAPWGGRDWHCGLCNQWVTPDHLATPRHMNRAVWAVADARLSQATDWQQQLAPRDVQPQALVEQQQADIAADPGHVDRRRPAAPPPPPPPPLLADMGVPPPPARQLTRPPNVQQPDAGGAQSVQQGGAPHHTPQPLITSLAQLAPEVIDALMEMLMSRLHGAAAQQLTPTAATPDEATWQVRDSDWSYSPGDSSHRGWHAQPTHTATTPDEATWQARNSAWSYGPGDSSHRGWRA